MSSTSDVCSLHHSSTLLHSIEDLSQCCSLNHVYIPAAPQTFDTTPGAYYDVTFYLSKNPDNADDKKLHVLAPGQDVEFTCKLTNELGTITKDNMLWQKKTVTFLATAAKSTLTFAETDPNDGGYWGCALDFVSVKVSDQSKCL